jgi:hypothetical protein
MAENTTLVTAQVGGPMAVGSIFSKVDFEVSFTAAAPLASGDYATLYTPGAGYKIAGANIESTVAGTATSNISCGDGTVVYGNVDLDQAAVSEAGALGVLTDSLRITGITADAVAGTVKVTAFVTDIS